MNIHKTNIQKRKKRKKERKKERKKTQCYKCQQKNKDRNSE